MLINSSLFASSDHNRRISRVFNPFAGRMTVIPHFMKYNNETAFRREPSRRYLNNDADIDRATYRWIKSKIGRSALYRFYQILPAWIQRYDKVLFRGSDLN